MAQQYIDYTSNISVNKSGDYVSLGDYSGSVPTVPQSSLLKLSVAPSNTQYWNATPQFSKRLDSFRIPQPASFPVDLVMNDGGYNPNGGGAYATAGQTNKGGDFQMLGQNSYKMQPY